MVDRRVEVVARLKSLEEAAAPLVAFLQNPNAVQELRADKLYNLQMLNERYQVLSAYDFLRISIWCQCFLCCGCFFVQSEFDHGFLELINRLAFVVLWI